jgi:hypothetical protein
VTAPEGGGSGTVSLPDNRALGHSGIASVF